MIVLIDVDGVVADLVGAWLRVLKRTEGVMHSPSVVHEWSIGKALGLPDHVAERVWNRLRRPGAHHEIRPYPGAREAVLALAEVADLYFVTAPLRDAPTWCYDRYHWLRAHLGIERPQMVYTKHKHLIDGDVLIEDNADTAGRWAAERRERTNGYCGTTAFLIDRPWNRGERVQGVVRTADLAEAASRCAGMAKPGSHG